jgi:predicted RNase H-like HicB family nuclease
MKRVRVIYYQEPGTWSADSPDAPGYFAVGQTLDKVKELVREGLPLYFEDEVVEIGSEQIVEEPVDAA